jgi:hypothetical protein
MFSVIKKGKNSFFMKSGIRKLLMRFVTMRIGVCKKQLSHSAKKLMSDLANEG